MKKGLVLLSLGAVLAAVIGIVVAFTENPWSKKPSVITLNFDDVSIAIESVNPFRDEDRNVTIEDAIGRVDQKQLAGEKEALFLLTHQETLPPSWELQCHIFAEKRYSWGTGVYVLCMEEEDGAWKLILKNVEDVCNLTKLPRRIVLRK